MQNGHEQFLYARDGVAPYSPPPGALRALPTSEPGEGEAPQEPPVDPVAHLLETMANLHYRAEKKVSRHQRMVEKATAFIGRPASLFAAVGVMAAWVLYNLAAPRFGMTRVDPPPFYWMQGVVGVAALLTTMVVLITQNRMGKLEERRAQLDLQINLLSEQKIAKLINLVEELRRDLPNIRDRHDPVAEAMQQPVDPQAMLVALEASMDESLQDLEDLVEEEMRSASAAEDDANDDNVNAANAEAGSHSPEPAA